MSTIKTNTISNVLGTKTVPTDTVVDGSTKAWVNFNGTGVVAIRRAFNVSSITDGGVGTYTINLTAAMSDSLFAVTVGFANDTNNNDSATNVTTLTTTSIALQHVEGGVLADTSRIHAAVFS